MFSLRQNIGGERNFQPRIATPPRVVHAKPPGPILGFSHITSPSIFVILVVWQEMSTSFWQEMSVARFTVSRIFSCLITKVKL